MSAKAFLITGTDTGVGKTVIAGAIAAYLRSQGKSVGVMKPAETGCRERGGELFPLDAAFLKKVSGTDDPLDLICPYRFAEPLAPAVAAKRAGVRIRTGLIKERFYGIAARHDVVIVEGAGGLMVPLWEKYLYIDLADELSIPLIIVARAGLGTINHTLLTLHAARSRGLKVSGIILNQNSRSAGAAEETNPAAIRELSGTRRVFKVPYMPGIKRDMGALAAMGRGLSETGFLGIFA